MRNFLILFSLLVGTGQVFAAVIFTEKTAENGQPYLFSEGIKDVAKNCPPQVRSLVTGRADVLSSGQYEKLRYYYLESAKIDSTITFLNNAPRHNVYSVDELIKGLQETWAALSQLLHLQMNGECEITKQYIKYSGSEVEKLVVKGKKPIYAVTNVTLTIDSQSYKVIEANEIGKIQYLQ